MTSIAYSPAEVLAYCAAGHTNAEASLHFSLHERTIRKMKARARGPVEVSPPMESCSQVETPSVLAHIPDDWIARDGQLWKCGRCEQLMPPLPGTTGAAWNMHGCYLHQAEPCTQSVTTVHWAGPARRPRPRCIGPGRPRVYRPAVTIVSGPARIVVRVPVERPVLGMLVWLPPAQVLAAVAITVVLLVLCYG